MRNAVKRPPAARWTRRALAWLTTLLIAALAFQVPFGVGQAATIRVGLAYGARDHAAIARAGTASLIFGIGFMSLTALAMLLAPHAILSFYIDVDAPANAAMVGHATIFLFVAAIFQLFDGVQGVATGVLRGLGDTRSPMLWNLAGHWFIGLPLGYFLCFRAGIGVIGLWWGLSMGLIICGIALLAVWSRRIGRLIG